MLGTQNYLGGHLNDYTNPLWGADQFGRAAVELLGSCYERGWHEQRPCLQAGCWVPAQGWRKAAVVAVRQWHSSEGGAGDVMGWDVCGVGGMAAPAASLPPNRGAMGVAALPAGLGR